MHYWIVKTEPTTYSFSDLLKEKKTSWTGVRNYAARIHLRNMRTGDLVLVYHSMTDKALVGLAKVTKPAFPDPTSDDPAWVAVEIQALKTLPRPIFLTELKTNPLLKELPLVKIGRLSVSPVTPNQFKTILSLV